MQKAKLRPQRQTGPRLFSFSAGSRSRASALLFRLLQHFLKTGEEVANEPRRFIYIIYKDMRTWGNELFYKHAKCWAFF
jgi:hypothetical protein